ncbi:hypothetical protein A7X12_14290 [Sphingomonas sp. TDK1]|nr:hypothetical protein A7X12_14290 [Sphingomonas sp. TDK1]
MLAVPAIAQDAAPVPGSSPAQPAQASPTNQEQLENIIVTARRTSENLQNVPVAASVLSSDSLERQQIRRATDLQFSAPSLVITPDPLGGSGAPVFQLRGQTSPLGADNTVVNYFGDVPVDSRVIAAGIFDLASVQIVRGPQGTLFGKNSTGGAVLFTPQRANTRDVSGYVTGNIGNYDLLQFTGAINLPIVKDILGVRLSGQVARQDGMVKNLSGPDGNDKDYTALRAAVTLTPVDGLENDLLVTYFNGKQHLNPPITKTLGGFGLFFPPALAGLARQQQLGNRTIDQSYSPDYDNNKSYLIANTTSYEFGGVTLKNIFGYYDIKNAFDLNSTSLNFPMVDVAQARHQTQISDELQVFGKSFENSLTWLMGGFISRQKTRVDQTTTLFSTSPTLFDTSFDRYTSKALFGQVTYDFSNLGLTGVKITGGLRHTWDTRVGSNRGVPDPLRISDKELSSTLGVDYQVTSHVLIYVANRHSYKAGGFNLISPAIPPALRTYAPEKLTDYEIGVKADAHIGRVPVRANLALYQGKYSNIQTQVTGSCGVSQNSNSLIVNAGKGTPKGIELELEARPLKGLQLNGFYNLTLGKYDQFAIPDVNGCTLAVASRNLTGQNFGNISRDTAGLTAIYTIPLIGNGEELAFNGNVYYRSSRLGNDLQGFNSAQAGYTLLNARIDYNNIGGSRLSAGIYARNITNELYGLTRNFQLTGAGYETFTYGDPRTYGVEATFRF